MTDAFVQRSVTLPTGSYRYSVYVPTAHRQDPCPVVTYLHGKGRGGMDGMRQTEGGLGAVIRAAPQLYDFVVIFPQSPDDVEWTGAVADIALAVIDDATESFAIGGSPQYLVGSSMGGHGVYHIAQDHAHRFRGLAVSCGSPFRPSWRLTELGLPDVDRSTTALAKIANRLRQLPLWVFHGALDAVVPVTEARRMVEALRAAGARVRYTEYPDGGHELCRRPYADPALWAWLFGLDPR